jgi:hypothetical protein
MLYGRPPFHHISKPLPKMQAIIDPKAVIEFPSLKEKWEKSGHKCPPPLPPFPLIRILWCRDALLVAA